MCLRFFDVVCLLHGFQGVVGSVYKELWLIGLGYCGTRKCGLLGSVQKSAMNLLFFSFSTAFSKSSAITWTE